jgi:ribosomal protein L16 Arg81 hydroxylase
MNVALGDDLHELLHPIGTQRFFSEYWNRRAVYIPGEPNKFNGLFDQSAFDAAAHDCDLLKVNYADRNGWPSEMLIRPDQIQEMLIQGRTVCAGGLEKVNLNLAAFIERFSKHFVQMGTFHFNAYLSPAGKGFGLHLDDHPVWILQIEGEKDWWFSPEPGLKKLVSTVCFPPGVMVQKLPWATIERPEESRFLHTVMRPGDMLYMPKATSVRGFA